MRNLVLAVAAALVLSGVPTALAVASSHTSATATLARGAAVLPGAAREFAIEVTNTSQLELLGGGTIDYVSILLPSAAGITTNPDVQPPSGWTVHITDEGSLQRLLFRTVGEPLSPGSSLTFEFHADVAAPVASDQSGKFRVAVSSDGGVTTTAASGDLTTLIKVLEVETLGAVGPVGVTDQTATSGQAITYGVTVRNHAQQSLSVTPTLASDHGGDAIGSADPANVASGKSRSFTIPVVLAEAAGERTFTGGARAERAEAATTTAELTVQAAPALTLDAASFTPRFVRSDVPIKYEFSVSSRKTNPPRLELKRCTLSFAGTVTRLSEPVEFGPGDAEAMLSFKSTMIDGDEGRYDVRVQCDGGDGNGFGVSYDLRLADLVVIDDTAPGVTIDLEIPDGQDAVKSHDEISITGTVDSDDAELDYVRLRTDLGETFPCTPSGTREFSCDVRPEFADGTTNVLAEAQATDAAGNVGGAASTAVDVDLIPPRLTLARTLSSRQLLVRFDDEHIIRGGCNPAQWAVDGHVVARVLFSNGDDCTWPLNPAGSRGPANEPSNYRILVLADQLANRDEAPLVSYSRSTAGVVGDDVFDAAANLARSAQVTAVPGILPPVPDLVSVTRTDSVGGGREPAVKDGAGTKKGSDTYWTNQPGADLQVEFAGGRQGDRVQAVDGNGDPIGSEQDVTSASGGGVVAVPIGQSDGRYVRGLRLINAAGAGDPAYFDVVLDMVAPQVSSATASGEEVTVRFTEVLAHGSDFANDWFAWERVRGGREYYQASRVDTTDDRAERLVTVPLEGKGKFGGVDYIFTSTGSGAARYEDRAGNGLADTHSFSQNGQSNGGGAGGAGGDGSGADAGAEDSVTKQEPLPQQDQAGDAPSADALANTGAPVDDLILLAAIFLGIGVVLVAATPPAVRQPRH